MPVGRPLKFKTVAELQEKIAAYFASCDEKSKPYTITGLALALDCDRDTLLNYAAKEEYFGTIKTAKLRCESYADEQLYRTSQVAGIIFNLKNNYGWKDVVETKNETHLTGLEQMTEQQLDAYITKLQGTARPRVGGEGEPTEAQSA